MSDNLVRGTDRVRRITIRDDSEDSDDEFSEGDVDSALMDSTSVARRVRNQIDAE
jgi:hypothetical protein